MKGRRAIPATELRVHLGEALRALDQEDIVVEKGGVPVAVITRYEGVTDMAAAAAGTAWSKAVVKPAEAGGWARAEAAMERGWSGISAEDLVESVRRARAEGTKAEPVTLDEASCEAFDHSTPLVVRVGQVSAVGVPAQSGSKTL